MKKLVIPLTIFLCGVLILLLCFNNQPQKIYSAEDVKNEFVKYLESKILDDGSFKYITNIDGSRGLDDYDVLRHALSYYALLNEYEKKSTKLENKKETIEAGIEFVLSNIEYSGDDLAYVISSDSEEIILGDCSLVTILMCEYQKVYRDDRFKETISKLANGIVSMQRLEGRFNHVYWAEWNTLKDQDRIIYYEGEAVIALCKAYEITGNDDFLN